MTTKKITLLAIVVCAIISFDQGSKRYVSSAFQLYESKEIIPNYFHITFIHNKGAAFGFLSRSDSAIVRPFFISITLVASAMLLWLFYKAPPENLLVLVGLSLLMGGAFGNFIDRLLLGKVVDFFDFHWYEYHWPAFNVADSAITVGVFLFLIDIFKGNERQCIL